MVKGITGTLANRKVIVENAQLHFMASRLLSKQIGDFYLGLGDSLDSIKLSDFKGCLTRWMEMAQSLESADAIKGLTAQIETLELLVKDLETMNKAQLEELESKKRDLAAQLERLSEKEREEKQTRPLEQNWLLEVLPQSLTEGIPFEKAAALTGLSHDAVAVHLPILRDNELAQQEGSKWKRSEKGDRTFLAMKMAGEQPRLWEKFEKIMLAFGGENEWGWLDSKEISERAGLPKEQSEGILHTLQCMEFVSYNTSVVPFKGAPKFGDWRLGARGSAYLRRIPKTKSDSR